MTARRATFNAPATLDQPPPECARLKDLGSSPSAPSGPAPGLVFRDGRESANSRYTASPAPAGSSRGPKPEDVCRARANPSDSFHPPPTTQGTGTQGKTCGQYSGVRQLSARTERRNSRRFSKRNAARFPNRDFADIPEESESVDHPKTRRDG